MTKSPPALSALLALSACAYFQPTVHVKPDTTGMGCEDLAKIEDAEDGDTQILTREGRGGYLYTFVDEQGSQIHPSSQGDFQVEPGGVDETGHAIHVSGTLVSGGDVYAGVGFSFAANDAPYDASRYRGLSFVARRAGGSTGFVRLSLPDVNTSPQGGVCEECYNDFGVDFEVPAEWTRFVVDFADLTQQHGWGRPRPPAVDSTRLMGMQWQASSPGESFDLWLDDIQFVGCADLVEDNP